MSKDLDRLKEMKEMTLDLSKRVDGDDYFIGLISKLKTSMNLICKEEYKIADDDMLTLDKNLSALIEKLHSCNEDLINYASLISNLQIKYNDDFALGNNKYLIYHLLFLLRRCPIDCLLLIFP